MKLWSVSAIGSWNSRQVGSLATSPAVLLELEYLVSKRQERTLDTMPVLVLNLANDARVLFLTHFPAVPSFPDRKSAYMSALRQFFCEHVV